MKIASIGIVGYGSFARLIQTMLGRFASDINVRIFSRRFDPDGKTFFSFEETCACDAVIIAVPIHAFEMTLRDVVKSSRKNSVIVDVATVKMHTVALLKRIAKGRKWIATHPMWGPESYKKRAGDVSGFRIVIAEHTVPKSVYRQTLAAFRRVGFDMVEMSAKEHDKHLAETLFLTHYIGQIVSRAGFTRTTIDTVSFGYLMDAVESVKHDRQLFEDVYAYNPFCMKILDVFEKREREVRSDLHHKK